MIILFNIFAILILLVGLIAILYFICGNHISSHYQNTGIYKNILSQHKTNKIYKELHNFKFTVSFSSHSDQTLPLNGGGSKRCVKDLFYAIDKNGEKVFSGFYQNDAGKKKVTMLILKMDGDRFYIEDKNDKITNWIIENVDFEQVFRELESESAITLKEADFLEDMRAKACEAFSGGLYNEGDFEKQKEIIFRKDLKVNTKKYTDKGEDWCTVNSDKIKWDEFICDMTFFSQDFADAFENEIQVYTWTDEGFKLHREDGPALLRSNGENKYYIHGKCLSELEFNKRKGG